MAATVFADALAAKGEGTGGLREVDLQVDSLDLLGSPFADTRVRLLREPARTRIDLAGPAVAGEILVPSELAQGVNDMAQQEYRDPGKDHVLVGQQGQARNQHPQRGHDNPQRHLHLRQHLMPDRLPPRRAQGQGGLVVADLEIGRRAGEQG